MGELEELTAGYIVELNAPNTWGARPKTATTAPPKAANTLLAQCARRGLKDGVKVGPATGDGPTRVIKKLTEDKVTFEVDDAADEDDPPVRTITTAKLLDDFKLVAGKSGTIEDLSLIHI